MSPKPKRPTTAARTVTRPAAHKRRAKESEIPAHRYVWKPASRFTKFDPQTVASELERLRSEAGVHVTAEQVVEAASDPLSPLHEIFQWDDPAAAHEHRLHTARTLLRSVKVVVTYPDRKEITYPAFVSTPRAEKLGARHYTTTEYAMGDPELRAHVLRQALSELAAFRRKYAELSELATVFAAIDITRKKAG